VTTRTRITRYKFEPYLYLVPIIVISGFFIYYCIGFTAITSFTDWDGMTSSFHFIGFENYKELFTDNVFFVALRNNLIFFVGTVFVQAALGLLIAVLVNYRLPGSNLYKSVFFLPISMAPVIISSIFRIILDPNVGDLNNLLRSIGLGNLAKAWLGDPQYALFSIIVVNIFQWMGFSMIIYYGGLISIPKDIYEAATIDGASFWQTLFHITIPMLRTTTTMLIVLGIVGSLKTFDIVMLLTRGGPGRSTEFLNTYLYKKAIEEFHGGYASSIGVMILLIAVVMSILQLKLNKDE